MQKELSFAIRQEGSVPLGEVILPTNRSRPNAKGIGKLLFIHDPQYLDRSVVKALKTTLVNIEVKKVLLKAFQFFCPVRYWRRPVAGRTPSIIKNSLWTISSSLEG